MTDPPNGESASGHELIGARVGNIRIVEVLGTGGMGAIFAGVDERLERRVAVKAIRHDRRLDADARARFLREARVLSRLEHPHICQIFEYVDEGDLGHFLVLELISGKTLDEVGAEDFKPAQKLGIGLQIAEVLVAAHEQGVVHRDLKPGNVMVTDAGEVKVLDFGLSRLVDEQREATLHLASRAEEEAALQVNGMESDRASAAETHLGAVVGTLSYMSPEQAMGERAGPASDMYSFGLVLQELFTGEPAYEPSANLLHKLELAKKAETRPVRGVDADLAALINRLKSLNPGARPSAQDTVERLRRIRDKPRRLARRLITAAAMVVLSLLSGGLAIQTVRMAAERDRAEAETAKATAINRFMQKALGAADPVRGGGREVTLLEALAVAVDRIDDELGDQPEIAAAVRATFGRTYSSLGRYDEAAPLLESALEARRRIHGDEHTEVASSLHELSALRFRQGELSAAEELLRRALEIRRRQLGERHLHFRDTLVDLGVLMEAQGELDEAEELLREALELSRARYGDDDPRVATPLDALAWTLSSKGELAEAEQLLRQALPLRRQDLGDSHPLVLKTMNSLGAVLFRRGELDEAEPFLRRSLELHRKVLGEEHKDVASCMHNLATLLHKRGELDEAEALLLRAVEIMRAAVGETHVSVANSLNHLGSVCFSKGDLDQAERYQRQALEIYRQLADDARPVFWAKAINGLAEVLAARGDHSEAERLYREALGIYQDVHDPDHWLIADTRSNLGACLTGQGRYAEAEELLLAAHRSLVATFGEEHSRSQKAAEYLDELYAAWNRPASD